MITSNQLLPKYDSKPGKDNAPAGGRSMPSRTIVHPKLEMTTPESEEEREANAVASDIVAGGKLARSISGGGQAGGITVSSQMESQLGQLQGQGQPIPEALRGMMERGFGRDFSQVRLHTDGTAAEMSSIISAKAFTHGNDIYFGHGQYSPSTTEGQQLVAHELTHVAQGNNGKVAREEDLSELTPEERQKKISSIPSTQVNEISYSSSLFSPYVPENQSLVGQLMTPMTQVNGNVASGDLSQLTPEERQKRIKRREIKRIANDFETRAKDLIRIESKGVIEGIVSPMDTSFHRGFLISEIDGIRRRLIVIQEKSEDGNANLTSLEADLEKEIKEIVKIQSAIGIHENNNIENAEDCVTVLGIAVIAGEIAIALGLPELKGAKAIGLSGLTGAGLGLVEGLFSESGNDMYGNSNFSWKNIGKKTGKDGVESVLWESLFQGLGLFRGKGTAAAKTSKVILKTVIKNIASRYGNSKLESFLEFISDSEPQEKYEEMEYSDEYKQKLKEWKINVKERILKSNKILSNPSKETFEFLHLSSMTELLCIDYDGVRGEYVVNQDVSDDEFFNPSERHETAKRLNELIKKYPDLAPYRSMSYKERFIDDI